MTKAKRKVRAAKQVPDGLKVELVALSDLKKWPRNPKRHDIHGIIGSIKKYGFTLPIMIDEGTGRIVAGHGREEALSTMREAGDPPPKNVQVQGREWMVPVIRGNDFGSEEEAEKYLIADNRFVEIGGWDPVALSDMISNLLADAEDDEARSTLLAEVGFSEMELARLTRAAEPEVAPDKFVSFTASSVPTEHECPRCKFRFSDDK